MDGEVTFKELTEKRSGEINAVGPVVLSAVLGYLQHQFHRDREEKSSRIHDSRESRDERSREVGRAEPTHLAVFTSSQLVSSSRWEMVKWLAASSLVTRDLFWLVIRTAQRPVGFSLTWYLTFTPASRAFSSRIFLELSSPTQPM